MMMSVGLRPYLSVGIPPNNAPTTVPHNADDMITQPWNTRHAATILVMLFQAPDMTTVNPNKNPAKAAINDHKNKLDFEDINNVLA